MEQNKNAKKNTKGQNTNVTKYKCNKTQMDQIKVEQKEKNTKIQTRQNTRGTVYLVFQ